MSGRSGAFWDAVEGRAPMPRAAATLGLEFIDADAENGTIELAFAATPGRIVGKGRVVHRDGDMAFLEASLIDSHQTIIATATATARVIALDQARAAA
jgi:acyl-coenzyme A thioesterase PaaI-like protein